jgi:hypothetical protein
MECLSKSCDKCVMEDAKYCDIHICKAHVKSNISNGHGQCFTYCNKEKSNKEEVCIDHQCNVNECSKKKVNKTCNYHYSATRIHPYGFDHTFYRYSNNCIEHTCSDNDCVNPIPCQYH